MNKQVEIMHLLSEKQICISDLEKLVYGSIEIRNSKNNKFIYTHTKDNGMHVTKYVGEYSEELYNLIINNNIKAKD